MSCGETDQRVADKPAVGTAPRSRDDLVVRRGVALLAHPHALDVDRLGLLVELAAGRVASHLGEQRGVLLRRSGRQSALGDRQVEDQVALPVRDLAPAGPGGPRGRCRYGVPRDAR